MTRDLLLLTFAVGAILIATQPAPAQGNTQPQPIEHSALQTQPL